MTYIATSDVEAAGGIAATDSADSDLVGLIVTRVQQFVDSYTGRTFECTSDDAATRYFTASRDVDGDTLWLDKDLNTVATIVAGSDSILSSDYTTEPVNEKPYYALVLTDNTPKVWDNPNSDGDYENVIQINAQWAYSSVAPADIKHACIRLARWFWEQYKMNPQDDRAVVLESGVTVLPAAIPKDVRDILDFYRLWVSYG